MFIIRRIRIEHYRAIDYLEISLAKPTVLIGPNHSGKSTIIHAIKLACSENLSFLSSRDFFTDPAKPDTKPYPIAVTLRIVPCDEKGRVIPKFDDEDRAFFAQGITEDAKGEYFAFKTEVTLGASQELIVKRRQIDAWTHATKVRDLPDNFLQTLPVIELGPDAGPGDELETQHVYIRSLVEALVSNFDTPLGLEFKRLARMFSETIVGFPAVLEGRFQIDKEGLLHFYDKYLADLSKISKLSPGTRRIILLLSCVLACGVLRSKALTEARRYFPIVLIEEPELHLHPNAQRALMRALKIVAGQLIVTTFSPFIAASCDPRTYRAIERIDARTRVRWLSDRLAPSAVHTVERQVLRHRSEMLFARAVIFAEGITEEQLFEGMFKRYFHASSDTMGVSIIGVGGKNYEPFILTATGLQKSFCIVSDNDGDTRHVLTHQIAQATQEQGLSDASTGVYFLSKGYSIEHEIVLKLHLREEIADALTMLHLNGRQVPPEEEDKVWETYFTLSDSALIARLSKKKAEYSGLLGEIIARNPYEKSISEMIPTAVLDAFDKIADWLHLTMSSRP